MEFSFFNRKRQLSSTFFNEYLVLPSRTHKACKRVARDFIMLKSIRGSRGGDRGSWTPQKNYKNIGFPSIAGRDPLKNHKAIKLSHHGPASETPFKWYSDPLSPHHNKDILSCYFTFQMHMLDCAFVVGKQQSQGFSRRGPYDVESQASWPPSGYTPGMFYMKK